jgi:RNA polymerase sigma-70 factor (ECF subfamily)
MKSTIGPTQPFTRDPVKFSEWSDEELLLDYCQHGDRRCFEELVHRYERELFSYLRRYLGSAEMAEDTFQQTFLQVHLKCHQYEPGRNVRPWLYTVATNQAIDAQRRNRRHRMASLDRRPGKEGEAATGALVDMLVREEPGPTELLESTEQREFVHDLVDRLADALKQVVVLVYYQGLKYREAAEVLDIPVGTVKSRLHAAIQKLNELITPTHHPQ